MGSITLNELSSRSIVITKPFESNLKWYNSPLTVLTDIGIRIFDFSRNFSSYSKKVDFVEWCIDVPKKSPATNVFPPAFLKKPISNINASDMFIDPVLWPHNPDLVKELACFCAYDWSTCDFTLNNYQIMAACTNMGHVALYGKNRLSWSLVVDLSDAIEEHYDLEVITQSLSTIRSAAMKLETSAVAWGTYNETNDTCFLATAQKDNDILFWLVSKGPNIEATIVKEYNVGSPSEIQSIHWITKSDTHFLLVYTMISGQATLLNCKIIENNIEICDTTTLWSHTDNMIVRHLFYKKIDGRLLIMYTKYRHLICQLLDENNNIIAKSFKNINQYKITNFVAYSDKYYVSTSNEHIYEIKMTVQESGIDVKLEDVITRHDDRVNELIGFVVSKHGLWMLAIIKRSILDKKVPLTLELKFMIGEDNTDVKLQKIFDAPLEKLDMWDYIEIIRCRMMKTKKLPECDMKKLYGQGEENIFKLKLYLIFLQLYITLKAFVSLNLKDLLPESCPAKVKLKILFIHALSLFKDKAGKLINNSNINDMDRLLVGSTKNYIEYYCKLNKLSVYKYVDRTVFDNSNLPKLMELCDECGQVLVDYKCQQGHVNMFCAFTLSTIKSDYMYCSICNATYDIRIRNIHDKCTFCDVKVDVLI